LAQTQLSATKIPPTRTRGGNQCPSRAKSIPWCAPVAATDIAEALVEGLRDFQALPLYGLAFGTLYAAGGIAISLCLTAFGMAYLAYPLAAGFALIGPFVAIGLYEVSRRRQTGQPVSFGDLVNDQIAQEIATKPP